MTATETDPPPATTSDTSNRWLYWTIGAVVVILAVIGLVTYRSAENDQTAQAKAQELTVKLQAAGLTAPHQEVLIRSFGTDGGAVCANPANALGKATMFGLLTNGASFVGQRPIIADGSILQAEALVLQTYCPDKAAAYQEQIAKLKTADLIRDR
jgi:hypothetical protein